MTSSWFFLSTQNRWLPSVSQHGQVCEFVRPPLAKCYCLVWNSRRGTVTGSGGGHAATDRVPFKEPSIRRFSNYTKAVTNYAAAAAAAAAAKCLPNCTKYVKVLLAVRNLQNLRLFTDVQRIDTWLRGHPPRVTHVLLAAQLSFVS